MRAAALVSVRAVAGRFSAPPGLRLHPQNRRALDRSGPFRKAWLTRGKEGRENRNVQAPPEAWVAPKTTLKVLIKASRLPVQEQADSGLPLSTGDLRSCPNLLKTEAPQRH